LDSLEGLDGIADDGPVLAVSPHLDDAVMSVGATLAAIAGSGRPVVVCTVFAGCPEPPLSEPAIRFHGDCGLDDDAVTVRLAEDRAAVAAIGATTLHLPFLDALYRRRGDDWLCTWLGAHFDPLLPAEPELEAAITADLRSLLLSLRPAAVWTCGAVGGHVDHRMVLAATTAACATVGTGLAVWEDLPYAIGAPAGGLHAEGLHAEGLPADGRPGVRVDGTHLERKRAAIELYRSQLGMLFSDGSDWRADFDGHALSRLATHGAAELVCAVAARSAHASGLGLSPSR